MTVRWVNISIPVDPEAGSEEITLQLERVIEWELIVREVTIVHGAEPVATRSVGNAHIGKGIIQLGRITSVDPITAFSIGTLIEDHIESLEQ